MTVPSGGAGAFGCHSRYESFFEVIGQREHEAFEDNVKGAFGTCSGYAFDNSYPLLATGLCCIGLLDRHINHNIGALTGTD